MTTSTPATHTLTIYRVSQVGLEALEKLVEKVGRIDLHTGNAAGGLDALLQNLYRLRGEVDGGAKPA